MATTKTINVTNQTVSIPEFTDRPDARVFSDAEGKAVDGINANTQAIANKANYLDLVRTAETQSTPLAVIQAKYGDITAGDYIGLIYTSGNRWQYHGYKYNANNGIFVCSSYGNSTIVIVRVSGGTWTSEELARKSDLPACTEVSLHLPTAIEVGAGTTGQIFNGLDIWTSTITDTLSNKTLAQLFANAPIKGCVSIYATGVALIPDTLIYETSKLSLRYYNPTASAITVYDVRLLIFT